MRAVGEVQLNGYVTSQPEVFAGDGEMARLMREFDWAKTPLGAVDDWPQSLKTAVRITLTSRFSMWMAWGPELNFFYNDAYRHDTLGLKHSWALGKPLAKVWSEVWSDLHPRVETVLTSGIATWDEALLLFLERSGFSEETYHTFSYSPLSDETGAVAGVFCVVTEETKRVIGERRLALLRDLGDRVSSSRTEAEVMGAIEASLSAAPQDLPFALTYLFDDDGKSAHLACATGVHEGAPIAPGSIDSGSEHAAWPTDQILLQKGQIVVDDLKDRFVEVPDGPWDRPARQAVIVPIAQQGMSRSAGFLVLGVNPYRPLDESYLGFFDLLAGQIAGGLANARAYEAERRRAEELAKLDQAKTTFFSNVSHELRTPLTLMLGPLEDVLSSGDLNESLQTRIKVAHRNSLRLLKLVNTLLDFSRIEAGRVQASYEPVDLGALTAEIASSFRSACEQAGLRLAVHDSGLTEPVFVDRNMWEKIVMNLLSNALKYTFQGEIMVEIGQNGDSAEFRVRDTGTGIPADALPRLFERFYRVEGATGRTHEGTGIGLALVQELVKLHGGRVTAESQVGKGSEFRVTIPLGKSHLPADQIHPPLQRGSATLVDAFLGETQQWLREDEIIPSVSDKPSSAASPSTFSRIVVADDNADLRDYLTRLLATKYSVEAVSNGAEALVAARRETPDLILTDVMMPNLDGFGLLKAIREDENLREIPIVMLSARAGEEAKVEGLEHGADDYLVKPFSARELLARVQSNLELAHLRRLSAIREEKLRMAAEAYVARMKEFAESLPQMVSERDANGLLRWTNERFYEYTGRSVGEHPIDHGAEIVHPDDRATFENAWATAIQTGQDFTIEVRFRRHDGEMRWWLVSAVAVRDSDGSVERFYGSATEIHDQKEAEHELERRVERRTEELMEANREMEGFTYTVSHDLRSPLRSIIFNSGVLLQQLGNGLSEEHRELLERQVRSARKLATLIDELLKLSRVSRQQINLSEIDVSKLAWRVFEQVKRDSAPSCEIRVQEGIYVRADAQLLEFVFLNLIENACKFSPQGGFIEVGLQDLNGQPTLFVKDPGIGFDTVYAEKIFQPFERLVTEEEFPGTGIGLANVKRIVERHRGRVWVESTPGNGATFYFTLGSS